MTPQTKPLRLKLWQRGLLILIGLGLALLCMVGLFTFFPDLFPAENDPYERPEAGQELEIIFHVNDGDHFINMPGSVRPVPPEENVILTRHFIRWDADGFRLPHRQAENYPIVALGDSFTEGVIVAQPWPDLLAAKLDIPVYNYGFRAYGPLETRRAALDYALKKPHEWVLYAVFSGNDLYDITRQLEIPERGGLFLLENIVAQAAENTQAELRPLSGQHYDFPLPVIIGANYYELTFLPEFLWVQAAPPQGFAASRNMQVMRETLQQIQAASRNLSETACHVLIFIPSKPMLYYPYIVDSERRWLRLNYQAQVLDNEGWLRLTPAELSEGDEAAFIAGLGAQRDALQSLALEENWHFIDLTPAFMASVAAGELLFYPYDSHWNAAGHELAAEVIAQAMPSLGACPALVDTTP